MAGGRKNKYEEYVLPHLDEIKEMIQTMTEKQIAMQLGVSEQSFNNYKKEHEELRQALKEGRKGLVSELKSALKKKAFGYTYEESKVVIRKEDGKESRYIEKYTKVAHPDTGAIHLLLKNLDPDWHNDDSTVISMKEAELELKKIKIEQEAWE